MNNTLTEKKVEDASISSVAQRLKELEKAVSSAPKSICAERALLVTEYFKDKNNKEKPMVIQKAEALAHVLNKKAVRIYPHELIVGSSTSKRVAGPIYPELHGLPVLEDLFNFANRKLNPLEITKKEKAALLKKVVPFWITKFLVYKSMSGIKLVKFAKDQLNPKFYLINETGGVGHLTPDHETLLSEGLDGFIRSSQMKMDECGGDKKKRDFYKAVVIICEGVIKMADNYAKKALELADETQDPVRASELRTIANNLKVIPRKPPETFHQALQSVWLLHTAIFLEGLDNGISFGRVDQYLYPFYKRDKELGILNDESAKELLGCFGLKSAENIPVFSSAITECHGGLLSGQAMTLGGIDKNGKDVTNELSYIILDLMDQVRMRQPNYHARLHPGSPDRYVKKIVSNLAKGVNSPAIYNDEVIIRSLERCGFSSADANEYGTLGCVEINTPGKTFGSTDAALVNLPICLEMALNDGKLFGNISRSGSKTGDPRTFSSIEQVKEACKQQLQFIIDQLVDALAPIELGNRDFHPTPLTSAMIRGCIQKGEDVTEGGAEYNFSGVQGVGVSDLGDSLFAINELVFVKKKYTLGQIIKALKSNFKDQKKMQIEMQNVQKFGNDVPEADAYSSWVAERFYDSFEGKVNTRGGDFVAGFYSTTTHYSFGTHTGALPNGRHKGKPFSSGISPSNGLDKLGPTAMFNSITAIDYERAHNGVNVNAKFDLATLKGEQGKIILESLLLTYFQKGGMQLQLNVFNADMLKEARDNPEKFPWLIVRVSGYSAYFNDLSPAMKDEIIERSTM